MGKPSFIFEEEVKGMLEKDIISDSLRTESITNRRLTVRAAANICDREAIKLAKQEGYDFIHAKTQPIDSDGLFVSVTREYDFYKYSPC